MKEIFLVTTNRNKFREIKLLLPELRIKIFPFGYPELQSESLESIASYGAKFCSRMIGKPVLVEDSGLFIHSLKDFPGPYSSFVFEKIGNDGILKLMEGERKRGATFKSVVAFCYPRKDPVIFKGSVKGRIAEERRGRGGFGFDPIFFYHGKTFAELSIAEKNAVSHRGKAVRKFRKWIK
jgi:XTP/dITP diphosphohydrolase